MECEGGEDRAFGCGVESFDVGTRICFGEAEFLGLLEGRLVAEIASRHGVEDEVRGAVHDADNSRDAVPGKGLAQPVDDWDGASDGGLVVEVGA